LAAQPTRSVCGYRLQEGRNAMKPSEYGGSDTDKTDGIQPFPHERRPFETLRLLSKGDPADPEASVEIIGDLS